MTGSSEPSHHSPGRRVTNAMPAQGPKGLISVGYALSMLYGLAPMMSASDSLLISVNIARSPISLQVICHSDEGTYDTARARRLDQACSGFQHESPSRPRSEGAGDRERASALAGPRPRRHQANSGEIRCSPKQLYVTLEFAVDDQLGNPSQNPD